MRSTDLDSCRLVSSVVLSFGSAILVCRDVERVDTRALRLLQRRLRAMPLPARMVRHLRLRPHDGHPRGRRWLQVHHVVGHQLALFPLRRVHDPTEARHPMCRSAILLLLYVSVSRFDRRRCGAGVAFVPFRLWVGDRRVVEKFDIRESAVMTVICCWCNPFSHYTPLMEVRPTMRSSFVPFAWQRHIMRATSHLYIATIQTRRLRPSKAASSACSAPGRARERTSRWLRFASLRLFFPSPSFAALVLTPLPIRVSLSRVHIACPSVGSLHGDHALLMLASIPTSRHLALSQSHRECRPGRMSPFRPYLSIRRLTAFARAAHCPSRSCLPHSEHFSAVSCHDVHVSQQC